MNSFLRKGANAQSINCGGDTYFAPLRLCVGFLIVTALLSSLSIQAQTPANEYLFNDTHFHLTNYI